MTAVVLALAMLAASLAGGLALSSRTERLIAAAHRRAAQAGYLAESAAERVVVALEAESDWRDVPGTFVVGDTEASAEIEARTEALNRSLAGRFPMAADTPRWRVAATATEGVQGTAVVWVADDPADRDGRPGEDSNGRLMVRAEVRGAAGAVRVVEVHLGREEAVTRRLSWREVW